MDLVLASASPARAAVLRGAGVDPVVEVSGVDEDAVAAGLCASEQGAEQGSADPRRLVIGLAAAKAAAVAERVGRTRPEAVVVGCDSMLLAGGELVGKPGTVEVARKWWRRLAGNSGELLTGHAVVRLVGGVPHRSAEGAASTTIRFGNPPEQELEAYLASGEPLAVAGGFTLDGLGGWFVDGVDGDPSSVIGLSLPLTRRLMAGVGVSVVTFWRRPTAHPTEWVGSAGTASEEVTRVKP